MNICRPIALAAAAAAAVSAFTACDKKNKMTASVPIIVESVSDPTTEPATTLPVETYPDYPVTYPEIEKQTAGNLYEAENGELKGGARAAFDLPEFSGDGYVTGFGGEGKASVAFDIDVPTNQHYDLSFNISSEKAVDCRITLGGQQLTVFKTNDSGKFTYITLYGVFLTKGMQKLEITPENGDMCLDYLKIENNTSLSDISYDAKGELVNKNAGESAKELMSFLSENYGKHMITGQYASGGGSSELDLIYRTTGKYPVIRFSNTDVPDESFDESFKEIDAAAEWYLNGGISCLSWYWSSPSDTKSSIHTEETDFDISKAVTSQKLAELTEEEIRELYSKGDISRECYGIILDIDNMAGQLTSLKNRGVPVLWRPLPEGCGNWFWWGAKGEKPYKWLWQLIYDRFTKYFELDNLIWVWNGQSESSMVDRRTFDIASVDLYLSSEKDYGHRYYEEFAAVQKFVGTDKILAISECGSVPDMDAAFRDNAVWSFFGVWYGKYVQTADGEYNEEFTGKDALIRAYNSDGALTLDEYRKLRGFDEPETEEKKEEKDE
ncbi:glycosyl hydrolase [uncultured Ruminococcus sp.]|uniref:glycosyl hydrolase n=1 Tax=uncultured Ruminococcus sp. TaxID=165186 RepID=UPI0025E56838|nr:glycosyl hydrolase [uncultured Ruminococcus sp.]